MQEEKSMWYTILLGVCMLLCLLMIGRMLLGHPVQQSQTDQTPPDTVQEGDNSIEIQEQVLQELVQQALPVQADDLTVHIDADGTIAAACVVSRQKLQQSGLVPGELRTALLFLPDSCKLYGAWQVSLQDGLLQLHCQQARLGDIPLPESLTGGLTEQLSGAVNRYLAEQGVSPKALQWEQGKLSITV